MSALGGGRPSLPASLAGAVDLSAFAAQKANERAREASGVASMTEQNANDVVQESLERAVFLLMVSAAAPQCADLTTRAAAILAPYGSAVTLYTVDVDAEQGLAQVFQVQAVPAMLALIQGRPIPMFQGSPEDPQLTQVVSQVLEIAAQAGLAVPEAAAPAEAPLTAAEQEAFEAIDRDDFDAAIAAFDKALKENPKDLQARAGKAQVSLMKRTRDLDPEAAIAAAQGADATPEHILAAADAELAIGATEAAIERLLAAVALRKPEITDAARVRLLEFFDVIGVGEPLVVSARKRLAALLY